MTPSTALNMIRETNGWELALLYDDGEVGCVDATTQIAEHLMVELPDAVVGIYRREHARHFVVDLRRHRMLQRKAA